MVIGGTNINRERSGLARAPCDVLVATPGRLQDHIGSTDGFAGRLWGVQARARARAFGPALWLARLAGAFGTPVWARARWERAQLPWRLHHSGLRSSQFKP